jgi:hypothetical protein
VKLEATAVILGVGTRACPLGIPGEAEQVGRTVVYEVRDLLRELPGPRAVVVVGGGEAALDYALTLASAGAMVRIVVRAERPRAAARLRETVAARRTIELRTGVFPEHILATSSGVRLDLCATDDSSRAAGSLAADAVLVAVATALSRDDALVGRYGGDEFVAILRGADRAAAEGYRSKATDALAGATVTDPQTGESVPVEASIGLAVYPEDGSTLAALIKFSDSAMYAAKRQRPVRRPSPRKHAPDRKAA